jgi:hypothetical protein
MPQKGCLVCQLRQLTLDILIHLRFIIRMRDFYLPASSGLGGRERGEDVVLDAGGMGDGVGDIDALLVLDLACADGAIGGDEVPEVGHAVDGGCALVSWLMLCLRGDGGYKMTGTYLEGF